MKFTGTCYMYLTWNTGQNEYVPSKVESLVGPREPLRAIVKRWKLIWAGHVTRHYSLCKLSIRRAPSIAFVGEGDNVRAGPTTPYNGQTWQCQISWRGLYRESGLEADSVKGLMMVMTVRLNVALFRICLWCTTLAIDRHCPHVASDFQSNDSNHCNTCGIFYHLWNGAENHFDLAAEVTAVFLGWWII